MTCSVCGGEARRGIQFCRTCDGRLTAWLREIPDLFIQLDITITRQDRFSVGREGGRSATRPLPFNEGASNARADLDLALVNAAKLLGGMADLSLGLSGWLIDEADRIRTHLASAAIYAEIEQGVKRARRAIDRPAEKVFAGPCNTEISAYGGVAWCVEDLYALPGKETVTCRVCGTEHDVQSRREWMLAQLHDEEVDAGLMASTLTQLGFRIHSATIRRYAADGLLTVASRVNGTPRYRIGEVLNVFLVKKSQQGRKKSA